MYKLIVFVPNKYLDKVRSAIWEAGAGKLGNHYDLCSFACEGVGTFRPLKGAKPFIGKAGKLTKVKEFRLEVIVKRSDLKKVIIALKKAHPYEEPAYEIYQLY